ncbi:response regulator transcription factor [Microbacterium sp. NPDC012755]|uniref:response regulator transcription factor n=1 Tax=Microbacterium sp. NPDC012755 TaxID=3364184 RepID=UPI00369FA6EB
MSRTVALVRDGWFDLLRENSPLLRETIEWVPSEGLRDSPLLAMFAGLLFYGTPHRRLKGLRLFVGATRAAATNRRVLEPIDRALILTSASVSYRLIGRATLGVKPARTAMRILNEMSDADRQRVHALPRVYSHLGATLYYGGHVDEALSAFEHGLAEVPRQGYPHGFMNLAMLAGIHALQGTLRESETYLVAARSPDWSDTTRSMYPGTYYRIAEATVALEVFDTATARQHLEAMVHDRATIEHWIPIALTEAMTNLVDGRPGEALAGLDAFAASRQKEGRSATAKNQLAPMRALLQLALENPDAAVAILDRDAAPGPARDISRARTDLLLGRHGAALHRLRRLAGATLTSRLSVEASALEAACVLRIADQVRTRPTLERLGATLAASGQRLALALLPAADFDRVQAALRTTGYQAVVAALPAVSLIPEIGGERLLSEREHAVLQALVNTSSNAAIANDLVVSVNTVKTQLRSIYRKLGVSTRDEAIAVALARHLASVHPPSQPPR